MDVLLGVIVLVALLLALFAVQQVKRRDRLRRARARARGRYGRIDAVSISARSEMRAAEDTTTLATTIQKLPREQASASASHAAPRSRPRKR